MTVDRPWTCPPTLGCSATDGVSAETSRLANTSPETRSLSRWPPKLFGIAGHATHELRTSTKNLLRVSYEGRQRKRGVWRGCATWKRHLAGFLFLWHYSERLYTYRQDAVRKGDPLCLTTSQLWKPKDPSSWRSSSA